ncbi:MAG TPA: hypothetical protein VHO25_10875, partial [Polyangiaceae bacterium]|nr:hypothetical protein [Polyangiaceae bacterium]
PKVRALVFGILLGIVCFFVGVVGWGTQLQAAEKKGREAQQVAADAKAKEEKRNQATTEANASLPALLGKWEKEVADVTSVEASADNVGVLHERVRRLIGDMTSVKKRATEPAGLMKLDGLLERAGYQAKVLEDGETIVKKASAVVAGIDKTTELMKGKAWISAETAAQSVLDAVKNLESSQQDSLNRFLPKGFKVAAKRATVEQMLRTVKGPADRERVKQAAEEAYRKLCGPKPVWSGWDGEIVGLESAIARSAHDPDSIDVENCTDPVLMTQRCWRFTCEVRGNNAFGAKVLNVRTFYHSEAGGFEE